MHFGTQFKEYREEYLHLKQIEAAHKLNIDPAALSNYERNERGFPVELLPVVKETFTIPDDYFLAMVLGRPLKLVRIMNDIHPAQTGELRTRYMNRFMDNHRQLFEDSQELRELVGLAANLTAKDRRNFLNAIKPLLRLFQKLNKQQDLK